MARASTVFVALAALFWGLSGGVGGILMAQDWDPFVVSFYRGAIGLIFVLVWLALRPYDQTVAALSTPSWPLFAALGVFGAGLSFVLYIVGLNHTTPTTKIASGQEHDAYARGDGREGSSFPRKTRVFSCSRSHFFLPRPPAYPVSRPPAPMTRWQGMRIEIGLQPLAAPTARTALGRPRFLASSPYVRVSPSGISSKALQTDC